jgi:hypothetical protein
MVNLLRVVVVITWTLIWNPGHWIITTTFYEVGISDGGCQLEGPFEN